MNRTLQCWGGRDRKTTCLWAQRVKQTDEGQSEKDREERKSKTRGSTEMNGKKLRESLNHGGITKKSLWIEKYYG